MFTLSKYNKLYGYLVAIRIILVFLPQTGYIHPDEYFQSVEVLAGRIFNVEAKQPWEFNVTFPVRSMAVPYFTVGTALQTLKIANIFLRHLTDLAVITPYTILVFTRLLMCCLSFLVDFSLYKICTNNNEKYKSKLLILASSYIMIVYSTRTFSNTMELILFALLLYFVAESLTFSNIVTKEREYLNLRYKKSKTVVEKAKFHKLRLFLTTDSLRNVIYISTLSVLGFFNRPTFLFFAIIPIFFWLYRGLGYKSVMTLQFHLRMVVFIVCAIPTTVLIVVVDSFYYGYISWGEIGMLDVSINSFVFTPLNFFKYNVNVKNLAQHGLHSRHLHLLVNIPLLFNVLGLIGIWGVAGILHKFIKQKYHLLPTIRSIRALMTASMVVPFALLSLVPHQEPRFLIPIIVPLVYLHAPTILEEPSSSVIKAQKLSQKKSDLEVKPESNYVLLKLWVMANAICILFYGFVHQGGVYPATSFISEEMRSDPALTNIHVFSSHIYSIPESLFLQKATNRLYYSNAVKYQVSRRLFLHEEGSNDLGEVFTKIQALRLLNEKRTKTRLYLVIPSVMNFHLHDVKSNFTGIALYERRIFYPHISVEALSYFPLIADFHFNFYHLTPTHFIFNILDLCSLTLYEIKFVTL